jgi:hypothetical protein
LDGNGHGLIQILSWHFPDGTEETHEKPYDSQCLIQDSNQASQIQVESTTTRPACLMGAFLEKIVVAQVSSEDLTFNGTQIFITVFTRACHWTLS